jgi:hypothetical protein
MTWARSFAARVLQLILLGTDDHTLCTVERTENFLTRLWAEFLMWNDKLHPWALI